MAVVEDQVKITSVDEPEPVGKTETETAGKAVSGRISALPWLVDIIIHPLCD